MVQFVDRIDNPRYLLIYSGLQFPEIVVDSVESVVRCHAPPLLAPVLEREKEKRYSQNHHPNYHGHPNRIDEVLQHLHLGKQAVLRVQTVGGLIASVISYRAFSIAETTSSRSLSLRRRCHLHATHPLLHQYV